MLGVRSSRLDQRKCSRSCPTSGTADRRSCCPIPPAVPAGACTSVSPRFLGTFQMLVCGNIACQADATQRPPPWTRRPMLMAA